MPNINFQVSDEFYEATKDRARQKGLNLASYVRSLIAQDINLSIPKQSQFLMDAEHIIRETLDRLGVKSGIDVVANPHTAGLTAWFSKGEDVYGIDVKPGVVSLLKQNEGVLNGPPLSLYKASSLTPVNFVKWLVRDFQRHAGV